MIVILFLCGRLLRVYKLARVGDDGIVPPMQRILGCQIIFVFMAVTVVLRPLYAADSTVRQAIPAAVIVPLSGDLAPFGNAFRQGVELMLSESSQPKVRFIFEDDRSGSRLATVSALQAQIKKSGVKIVVVTGAPTIVPVDPIVNKEGIIAFSAFDSNERIDALSANSFGYGWSNELTGRAIGEYACRNLGLKKVAIVDGHDEWSEIMSQAFSGSIKRCGVAVDIKDTIDLSDTDFRTLAVRIAKSKPDGVYLPLYGPALTSLIKQLRQAGYAGTMLSAESVTEVEVEQLGAISEGMYITSAYLFDDAFEKRYRKKFGASAQKFNLAHVALGYEFALFIEKCVEQLEASELLVEADNLRAVIEAVEVSGPLGAISFRGHKRLERKQGIMKVVGGALVPVQMKKD